MNPRTLVGKLVLIGVLAILSSLWCFPAGRAWAANSGPEPRHPVNRSPGGDARQCDYCHRTAYHTKGPHGIYSQSTDFCQTCHQEHQRSAGGKLGLPGNSVTEVCMNCHDLTQSRFAPYSFYNFGAVSAVVYSAHRVAGIRLPNSYTNAAGTEIQAGAEYELSGNIIPGGSANDGGWGFFNGAGQGELSGNNLTCISCHTVHALAGSTVRPYLSEAQEKVTGEGMLDSHEQKIYLTDRLLRSRPNAAGEPVDEYGPRWCLACHQGRNSNFAIIHNHPVNERGKGYRFLEILPEGNFIYPGGKVQAVSDINAKGFIIVDDGRVNGTIQGAHTNQDPRTNRWWTSSPVKDSSIKKSALTGAKSPAESTDGPACQQCHGNPRDVEKPFSVQTAAENPYRMSFPHVNPNPALLVETGDDLCTNCHGINDLP